MKRFLAMLCTVIFIAVGCGDSDEVKDAAPLDAAVDAVVQLEASAEVSTEDLVVTETAPSDAVVLSDAVTE